MDHRSINRFSAGYDRGKISLSDKALGDGKQPIRNPEF